MKRIISFFSIAFILIFITSCGKDEYMDDEYYWCEYHQTNHCNHINCDKVKYCKEHNGYYTPEHWKRHQHIINYND